MLTAHDVNDLPIGDAPERAPDTRPQDFTQRTLAEREAELGTVRDLVALTKERDAFMQRLDPGHVNAEMAARRAVREPGLRDMGFSGAALEQLLHTQDETSRRDWDAETTTRGATLHFDLRVSEAAAEQRLEASRQPPAPPADRLVEDLRLLALRTLYEGAPEDEVYDAYREGTDASDVVLTRLVELHRDRLGRMLKLAPSSDVFLGDKWSAAIEARRAAREDTTARATIAQIRALRAGTVGGWLKDAVKRTRARRFGGAA